MNQGRRIGTGASSVLMIFVVLCLTAFGVLSLVSARADKRLTDRAKTAAQAYYAADAAVEETLAAIDGALLRAAEATDGYLRTGTCGLRPDVALPPVTAGPQAVYEVLAAALLTELDGVTAADGAAVFTRPAGERQSIVTTLTLRPYGQAQRYTVTGRRVQTLADEDGEPTMQVWPGK